MQNENKIKKRGQGKSTDYEMETENLKKQLADTKIKSAVKVALLSEKVVDVENLIYKLKEDEESFSSQLASVPLMEL